MTDAIRVAISIAVPTVTGLAVLRLLGGGVRLGAGTEAAVSFGLGAGILAHWMFFLEVIGVKFGFAPVAVPLLIVSAALFLAGKYARKKEGSGPAELERESDEPGALAKALYLILWVYVAYYFIYIFWRAVNVPVQAWDALSSVAFKGKVFFYKRWFFHLPGNPPHAAYPILIPLLESWVAFCIGRWSDLLVKIIFPVTTLSFAAVYHYFLKTRAGKVWALFGVALLLSSNLFMHHSTIAYRDTFIAFYACGAILFLLMWYRNERDMFLVLAGLYAGFGTFTKMEGIPYLLICTALLLLTLYYKRPRPLRDNVIKFLKFTAPSYGIALLFNIYKLAVGFPPRKNSGFELSWENMDRVPVVIKSFLRDMFLSGNWNIVWALLVVSLIVHAKRLKARREAGILLAALLMFFGLYFALSLFTTEFVWIAGEKSGAGLSRLIMQFYPLAPLIIVLLNCPDDGGRKEAGAR